MIFLNDDLPFALYSSVQMRELDTRLINAGTPGFELMRRAAHAAWSALRKRWSEARRLTVLAGHGNNAGDGYLIATLARHAGWRSQVLEVAPPERLRGDAAQARSEAQAAGVVVQPWSICTELDGVVVDALLGTGLSGPPRKPFDQAIRLLNVADRPVLAVDIPSGLSADTGAVLGEAVRAELTVTFIGLKIGLFTGEAPNHVGELVFNDLGADADMVAQVLPVAQRLTHRALPLLAARERAVHKGRFGHLLVAGGDRGMGGAVLLAGESALRCGAGLVSVATRAENVPALLARCPEIMAQVVTSGSQLLAMAERADVLVLGPGLGRQAWGRSLLSAALSRASAQVWDADALNLLAQQSVVAAPKQWILTPHPGEAARLLGCSIAEVQSDRPAAALELAQRFQAVLLLKGAGSLVAAPDGRLAVCSQGHPAMAGAGLGDVLSGVVGALLAQAMPPFEAACLATWLHATAGERLGAGGRGLAASDLIPTIRQLLEECSPCLK